MTTTTSSQSAGYAQLPPLLIAPMIGETIIYVLTAAERLEQRFNGATELPAMVTQPLEGGTLLNCVVTTPYGELVAKMSIHHNEDPAGELNRAQCGSWRWRGVLLSPSRQSFQEDWRQLVDGAAVHTDPAYGSAEGHVLQGPGATPAAGGQP